MTTLSAVGHVAVVTSDRTSAPRLVKNSHIVFVERLSDKEIAVAIFAPEDGEHALAYGAWFRASQFDAFKTPGVQSGFSAAQDVLKDTVHLKISSFAIPAVTTAASTAARYRSRRKISGRRFDRVAPSCSVLLALVVGGLRECETTDHSRYSSGP